MPNWKKLIVSGSSANLSNLTVDNTLTVNNITAGAITGSYFIGDGSALTGISAQVTEQATISDSFTNVSSQQIAHNFNTKNVLVSVYDDNDQMVIPTSIRTTDVNTVDIIFNKATSGRTVIAKGGHLVSGSAELYTHRETVSGASMYNLDHNLNEDFPVVQVYDTFKKQVIPQDIESTSSNRVQITFNSTFNGTVVVKK